MLSTSFLILLASAGLLEARSMQHHQHQGRHLHGVSKRADADSTTLAADAIQTGSFVDGSSGIGGGAANQAASATSTNNFINFCSGKELTNGLQIVTGSCNGIPMGDMPAKTNMISSIITFPKAGSSDIVSDTTFTISVQTQNLVAGSFTNADANYYTAPQQLSNGKVIGHTHVTVQDMGSDLNPTQALDPTKFAFFKGINDVGNGAGLLSATVTGGLPAGNYRVCTLTSASNHQAVLMPVAQRGTVDDCTKFTVTGSGTTENSAANDGAGGKAAAAAAASAVAAGPAFEVSKTAGSAATSAAATQALGGASSSSICTVVTGTVTVTRAAASKTGIAVAAVEVTSSAKAIATNKAADSVTIATTTSAAAVSVQAVATSSPTLGGATASSCGVVTSIITVDAPTATAVVADAVSSTLGGATATSCGVVTSIITVDAPTATAAASAASSSGCGVVTGTVTVTGPAASATVVSSSPASNGTVARRHF